MERVHGNAAATIKERVQSPKSPISPKSSFDSENDSPKIKANDSKFEKPPKAQSGLSKPSSLSSNKSRFSRLRSSRSSSKPKENGDKRLELSLYKKQDIISDERAEDSSGGQSNVDLGPFQLNQARNLIAESPSRALQLALRASKSFEKNSNGRSSLDLAMCLHVIAAILCRLEQYGEAIPILERAIEIPNLDEGHDHSLAKFSGYMQLGDTYAMLGQIENSIRCYALGLEVQKHELGGNDSRGGDTCRYLAEAHAQALQFDEAERLCLEALEIHRANGAAASLEEMADRRLLGLICDTKGDHEAALEHLVFASMGMISNGQESEVASVDCSIGDAYLSLARYDEAVFAYQKALTVFKSTKGENHTTVASVFVRLASLYHKIGKFSESRSYCERALRIYEKPLAGTPSEEIASGFTEISAIYVSMEEPLLTINLLKKALNIYSNSSGHQSTIAGIEAQLGVLYQMTGNYDESYGSFKNAIDKLRVPGEKKPAFFGIVLNQMGLACAQQNAINEAAELFEEARSVLEQECGPCHPDTLGVCSNLAGTYDAMGKLDEAIEILEHVVRIREEKLGTANPDVDDEKRRLILLLKEAGRTGHRKSRSLEVLLDPRGRVQNQRRGGIAV